jgi:hypothetical protein
MVPLVSLSFCNMKPTLLLIALLLTSVYGAAGQSNASGTATLRRDLADMAQTLRRGEFDRFVDEHVRLNNSSPRARAELLQGLSARQGTVLLAALAEMLTATPRFVTPDRAQFNTSLRRRPFTLERNNPSDRWRLAVPW